MLFEPLELHGRVLANRIVTAPLASATATADGGPSEKSLEIYRRLGSCGAGLVVVEHHAVQECGRVRPQQFMAESGEAAELNAEMARAAKAAGASAIVQINHSGAQIADAGVFDDKEFRAVSPSGVPVGKLWSSIDKRPYSLSVREIKRLVEDFAEAAVRMVKISGYDGVQIHACHGYLLGQFLSPLTNLRDDEYGGSDAKRARLLFEITDAVRQSLPDAIVSVRLGAADYLPDEKRRGLSLDETVPVARELVALGADSIHVSGNLCGYGSAMDGGCYYAPYAARIRDAVGGACAVECTGGIRTARDAEKLLEDGVCDLVGVGRPLLKDGNYLGAWKDEL